MAGNKKILKLRIKSVKSTQKITKAMKLVASAKLKKAKNKAINSLHYYNAINDIYDNISVDDINFDIIQGRSNINCHVVIVASSDRGLCGSFNSNIAKLARKSVNDLTANNIKAKILCVGKKSYEQLKNINCESVTNYQSISTNQIEYEDAENLADIILNYFNNNEIDSCSIIYNKFKSIILQKTENIELLPLKRNKIDHNREYRKDCDYIYEPRADIILVRIVKDLLATSIFHILLDNSVSEQAARMTAMDNATNSANDMLRSLQTLYNRTRQAGITRELIEIISGAEAV